MSNNWGAVQYDTEKTIIEDRILPTFGKLKLQALTPRTIKSFYADLGRSIRGIK
ncbi:N-terminal phage integrase SAM-like domain-containing protein [Paenibacillus odorifer]|uniref:N-terminal phage integrase SAM-like domain-containing protein n=1 Tax=Paenibacillus odorifer TaxID=189426 RepID=UPI00201E4753|nr:N-terminal phage integrase SAM-like domain-containing protein [Paenibacillus odorifer]